MTIACALVLLVGALDFWTDIHVSLLVFYLLPICLAVAAAGPRFGVIMATTCVAIWLVGDLAAGTHYPIPWIPAWNAAIALVTYLVVVWLLANLMGVQKEMEERIAQRTLALTAEIGGRVRLENAVLEISEREQRRIGSDLHDGLSRLLADAAASAATIETRLVGRGAPEAPDLGKVVAKIEQAIQQTRRVSESLLPADITGEGLAHALAELATQTGATPHVESHFAADNGASVSETAAATHLYRIAQEATANALRHSTARRIDIELRSREDGVLLGVQDNGVGLPLPCSRPKGLGLQIMAHRAAIMGARFTIEALPSGGTRVECLLPKEARSQGAVSTPPEGGTVTSPKRQDLDLPRGHRPGPSSIP